MERIRRAGHQILAGVIGGFLAGALVGAVEISLLALFTGDWWGCLETVGYAVTVYGVLCTALGALCGAGWGLWIAWRRRKAPTWPAYALVIAIGPLTLVTANRVGHDLLRDGASLDRAGYLLVLVLLVLALDMVFIGLVAAMRRVSASRHAESLARPSRGLALGLVVLLVLVGVSYILIPLLAQQSALAPMTNVPPGLEDRPNVIIILADALRADRLGCYGAHSGLTPAIDELAHDSVVYQNMTAQASWTKPSVATLLTSMYPSSHQAIHYESLLPDAVTTLPEVLSAAGYRTVAYSSNPYISPSFNFQQGFDELHMMSDKRFGAPSRIGYQLTFHGYATRALYFALEHSLPVPLWPQDRYQEISGLNEHVVRWLEANRRGRFFMYIHYMDPHDPYFEHPYNGYALLANQGYRNRNLTPEMKRLYDGEAVYLDRYVGRLLTALKAWGIYDETLVIFTADHGEEFNEHGGFFHGQTLYQEQVAVPLIIKYPRGAAAGTVDEGVARSLDITPTILDALGIEPPAAMQGFSLHPDNQTARPAIAFSEENRESNVLQAIRMGKYKLILANEGNPRGLAPVELYDLAADPGEQTNLAVTHPEVVRQLRRELDRTLAYALEHAVVGETGELDPATRERLQQLGY